MTPKVLKRMGRQARQLLEQGHEATPEWIARHAELLDWAKETDQVARMVVYLGYQRAGKMFEPDADGLPRKKFHFYTCKNLQTDGKCGVYATRPQMCSAFPYGRRCNYARCTWAEVKGQRPLEQGEYIDEGRCRTTG